MIAAQLATYKVTALAVGPSGIGLRALLQSAIAVVVLAASLGINVGMVRLLPEAIALGDAARVRALTFSARVIGVILGVAAAALLFFLRDATAAVVLGVPSASFSVGITAAAVAFTVIAQVETAILNGHQLLGALTRTTAFAAIASTIVGIALIVRFGTAGIAPSLVAAAVLTWIIALVAVRVSVRRENGRLSSAAVHDALLELVRFGGPYTASALVGTGVQLLLPVIAVHRFGENGAGLYRAATNVTITYLGFLLAAMAQDYYPRLASRANDAAWLRALANTQHHALMLVAAPVVLLAIAATPLVIPLLYTGEFGGAVSITRWQLAGDLLKCSSWTLSYVVLVRCGPRVFLGTEIFSGITLVLFTLVAAGLYGTEGLGIGYLLSYLCYLGLVFIIVRRTIGFRWTRSNRVLLGTAAASVVLEEALVHAASSSAQVAAIAALCGTWVVVGIWGLRSGLRAEAA